MAVAGGYVLFLDPDRRDVFLETMSEEAQFAEPVGDFAHARSAPLICFVVLDDEYISHIAEGRKGIVAGTNMRRLNIVDPQPLRKRVKIQEVITMLDGRSRARAAETLTSGGYFTPGAFGSAIDAISVLSKESRALLSRFSRLRKEKVARLGEGCRRALGQQKEALLTALAIAGIDRREIHDWQPPSEGVPTSFIDGLPHAISQEDAMIVNDLVNLPGFNLVRTTQFAAAVFRSEECTLTVLLANRLPLEQLTGTDLIYFNETHRSFVMVQYKAMERGSDVPVFRLPDVGLEKEVSRMLSMGRQLDKIAISKTKENFRLHSNPFYIKICSRTNFNPDDIKLFPGMYFPLEHWQALVEDSEIVGKKGGKAISYKNAGRYIDCDFFVRLVANAWIGCHREQSSVIEAAIRATIKAGRAVAIAIENRGAD